LRLGQHHQHLTLTIRHRQGGTRRAHTQQYQPIDSYFGDTRLVANSDLRQVSAEVCRPVNDSLDMALASREHGGANQDLTRC
jgi:hypothetical protein